MTAKIQNNNSFQSLVSNENKSSIGFVPLVSEIHLKRYKSTLNQSYLDKLALNVKFTQKDIAKEVNGFKSRKQLFSQASTKFITNSVLRPMLYLNSELHKQYSNAYYCGNSIQIVGGKPQVQRCKTRFCVQCNRNKTATLINDYLPVVENWKEKQFVTLTIPNVVESELKLAIEEMTKVFAQVSRYYKRTNNINLKFIRKTEVTYSYRLKNYHPHFHILVYNKEQSDFIVENWIKIIAKRIKKQQRKGLDYVIKQPNSESQDVRPADDNSVKELFKYFAKIWDYNKERKTIEVYTPSVLDTIYKALRGKQVIKRGGFKQLDYVNISNDIELREYRRVKMLADSMVEEMNRVEEFKTLEKKYDPLIDGAYIYDNKNADWFCIDSGIPLTHYKAPKNRKEWIVQNLSEEDSYKLDGYRNNNKHEFQCQIEDERELNKETKIIDQRIENDYIRKFNSIGNEERERILINNFN